MSVDGKYDGPNKMECWCVVMLFALLSGIISGKLSTIIELLRVLVSNTYGVNY
jgi:hypothetical protein